MRSYSRSRVASGDVLVCSAEQGPEKRGTRAEEDGPRGEGWRLSKQTKSPSSSKMKGAVRRRASSARAATAPGGGDDPLT
ncbi:Hypothetical predicted protein [Cloeon dipterum]|uniref:Uncharacterized protein n=1 Tax=Cloeon dipterum TaxID=197152 RepID=A0A8S1CFG5_9INSE|nr:Hypothetical predicted protein [Cloeon dipterum]